jgi:hypothetical protein
MKTKTSEVKTKITLAIVSCVGALFAGASLFFCYYTMRLAFLGATGRIDAAHRTAGLHIGAALFPLASFGFGWITLACFERLRPPSTVERKRKAIPYGSDSDR